MPHVPKITAMAEIRTCDTAKELTRGQKKTVHDGLERAMFTVTQYAKISVDVESHGYPSDLCRNCWNEVLDFWRSGGMVINVTYTVHKIER